MAITAPSPSATKDRAHGPGPSALRTLALIGGIILLVGALIIGILDLTANRTHLGSVPVYHNPLDRTLTGTVGHPALTIEGDGVEVHTPAFSALAVVSGPVVPGEGLSKIQPFTTCTWTVTISHVVGKVPIATTDFDMIDHLGAVYQPYLVPGEAPLPAVVTSGHHLTFTLRQVVPVGQGLMRWAPDGNDIVAKWNYQVEND